jgi:hypothetical protein
LKKKADEKKQMKDLERQQKLDRQKQDHAAKMAELDEEIRQLKEQAMDAQLSKDMKKALEQKHHARKARCPRGIDRASLLHLL